MQTLPKAKFPFKFVTKVNLTQLTARKAKNLQELVAHLREVPTSVIYHHTHRFLKQHQFLSPEPPNDFAYWVTTALQDDRLGEKLAAIDTVRFTSIRELREKIIQTIEQHLAQNPDTRDAIPGDELYLMQSISFILPTPYQADDLQTFAETMRKISIHSLYHHVFEARLRLEKGANDLSNWLETSLGEGKLAHTIAKLDPYTQTLESLRQKIIHLAERRIRELTHA